MHISQLDLADRRDVRRFIQFPFRLYRDSPLWVPPFIDEIRTQLDPNRHPFYQHSEAAFFVAVDGGEVVGRLSVLDNVRYREYHPDKAPTAFSTTLTWSRTGRCARRCAMPLSTGRVTGGWNGCGGRRV